MESNPQSSPEESESKEQVPVRKGPEVVTSAVAPVGGVRVYNEGAVALASLIGTPVAGGILLALNGFKLKRAGVAAMGLLMGLILAYSLLGLVGFTAQYTSPWMLLVAGSAVMWWVTSMLQGEYVKDRPRGPLGVAVLVGVVVAGALYFGLWPILERQAAARLAARQQQQEQRQGGKTVMKGKVASFGEKQVVMYVEGVDEGEVKKVGAALTEVGYFDKTGKVEHSVLMARDAAEGHLTVLFPVPEGQEKNQEVLKGFMLVARQLAVDGLEIPFVVRAVTPDLKKMLWQMKVDKRAATRPATGVVAPALGEGVGGASRP